MRVTAEVIDTIYRNSAGGNFRCDSCNKLEVIDETFSECARCGVVQYCSKECQKAHYKVHKADCKRSSKETDINETVKLQKRLERFKNFYGPMVHIVVSRRCELFNMEMNRGNAPFPTTHAVIVHLEDLPESAKKPRLRLGKIEVKLASEAGVKENADKLRSHYPTWANMITFVFQYHTKFTEAWRESLTLINITPYIPVRAYIGNKIGEVYSTKSESLAALLEWIKAVNDTAKGERPDLYKSIKAKQSMKQELNVAQSKLYPQFVNEEGKFERNECNVM